MARKEKGRERRKKEEKGGGERQRGIQGERVVVAASFQGAWRSWADQLHSAGALVLGVQGSRRALVDLPGG